MRKKPFWKYLIFLVVPFVLFLAILAGFGFVKFSQIQGFITMAKSGAFEPPPTAVTTDVAKRSEWQPSLESVGTVTAVNGVTVSTDLAGIVRQIAFESGNKVREGDLLVHLDVKVPTKLSREQRKLFEQLRDLLPVENDPQEKGIFDKVKDYFL